MYIPVLLGNPLYQGTPEIKTRLFLRHWLGSQLERKVHKPTLEIWTHH